jgi:hypothetical protein
MHWPQQGQLWQQSQQLLLVKVLVMLVSVLAWNLKLRS